MELKDLKVGLFGFKKNDVCEYISELNSTFSERLAEQKKEKEEALGELNKKNEELNTQISWLETEKDSLKRELEEKDKRIAELQGEIVGYCGMYCAADIEKRKQEILEVQQKNDGVTEILQEARAFADSLRAKAMAEDEAFRQKNRKKYKAEQARIAEYGKRVDKVKGNIMNALRSMKLQMSGISDEITALRGDENGDGGDEE